MDRNVNSMSVLRVKKERLKWVDFIKGFAILLVFLGHVVQFTYNGDYQDSVVFRYIYSFHMPLFMFVSGYVSYKAILSWNTIGKRAVQLLLPFFVWPIIYHTVDGTLSLETYRDLILNPSGGLWFLWVLFFCSTLLTIVIKTWRGGHFLSVEMVSLITVLALLVVGVLYKGNIFGIKSIANYYIYYCAGFWLKKYSNMLPLLTKYLPAFIILFVFGAFFWHGTETPTFMQPTNGIVSAVYRMATAFLGIATTFGLAFKYIKQDNDSFCVKRTNELGQHTLGLYAVQALLITLFMRLLSCISIPYAAYVAIIFILATISSYIVIRLLSLTRITSLLFLGLNKFKK